MIVLDKAYRDSYWWNAQGTVEIDPSSIESLEDVYKTTPGGSQSRAYTLIKMKSGASHYVINQIDEINSFIVSCGEK